MFHRFHLRITSYRQFRKSVQLFYRNEYVVVFTKQDAAEPHLQVCLPGPMGYFPVSHPDFAPLVIHHSSAPRI
jgi:hypothetical protein